MCYLLFQNLMDFYTRFLNVNIHIYYIYNDQKLSRRYCNKYLYI